jgi:hypothetical protein
MREKNWQLEGLVDRLSCVSRIYNLPDMTIFGQDFTYCALNA